MTVLRVSFLSSFVLELFASLSVAIVAVQVGLRLIGGSIELEAALIVLLLAPEGAGADHLKALARVARLLRDPATVVRLRESRDADALYAVLAMPPSEAA